MLNEYTDTLGPIKIKYIRIIEMKIKNNKYKGINKEEVEKEFLEIINKLYNKEIEYEKKNIKYRKNKKMIEEIIKIINKIEENKIYKIFENDIINDRIKIIKYVVYSTIIIIDKYINKKNNKNGIINNFKENKLINKINFFRSLKEDMEKLKKKMKVKDENKAILKLEDKIAKLNTIIEIDKLKNVKIKKNIIINVIINIIMYLERRRRNIKKQKKKNFPIKLTHGNIGMIYMNQI